MFAELDKTGRYASGANTDVAKQVSSGEETMSKHILPKIDEWTYQRRCYKDAWRALRLSLRVLPPDIKPFSYRHKEIYFELFDRLGGGMYKVVYEPVWAAGRATHER